MSLSQTAVWGLLRRARMDPVQGFVCLLRDKQGQVG